MLFEDEVHELVDQLALRLSFFGFEASALCVEAFCEGLGVVVEGSRAAVGEVFAEGDVGEDEADIFWGEAGSVLEVKPVLSESKSTYMSKARRIFVSRFEL